MLKSQKINGNHFRYYCSECHETIDPKYIFDTCCPHCKEKINAEEGDSAVCIGKIAWGCLVDCKHARSHKERTSDCRMGYCKYIEHVVACVHDGGPYT